KGVPLLATCVVRRRGDAEDVVRIFSRQDAQARAAGDVAGRMLTSRASKFCACATFSDVLVGLTDPSSSARSVDAGLDALPLEGEAAQEAPRPEPRRSDPVEPAPKPDVKT